MATSVLWHGSQTEALELLQALSRNCSCVVTAEGVRLSTCAPHEMLSSDQRAIDGLLFARRIAARLRLEEFKDWEKASRTWDLLISLTEKETDQRVWYLLACQQKKDAQDAQKKDAGAESALEVRQKLIGKWLDETRKLADQVKGDPSKLPERFEVRMRAREVVELYDDEDDKGIAAWVARAKQLIADVPKT